MRYLGIFGLEYKKKAIVIFMAYVITNMTYVIYKFHVKTKIVKYGTKPALFGYFGKQFSYMKSAPSNLPDCKLSCRNKNS